MVYSQVILTEAGGGTGPFSIDQSTAAIRLSSSLDYETKTSYVITVVATDGGGSQVETVPTKNYCTGNLNFYRASYVKCFFNLGS